MALSFIDIYTYPLPEPVQSLPSSGEFLCLPFFPPLQALLLTSPHASLRWFPELSAAPLEMVVHVMRGFNGGQ